eukprot:TRINITY_DN8544_c0_g2_i11.p1 TRINITY_DN8544_c0_g2~~TRINITY_DN8544_c0_g2_i11.p1  ORF type:complete len:709 (-),score=113.77 TRINITY_DN8544_c0_g2_i11:67-2193(-)
MTLEEIDVTGLTTWKQFKFFVPVGPQLLRSVTDIDSLGLNITFQLQVSNISNAESITELFLLTLNMQHNVLNATSLLAINETLISQLLPLQFLKPSCVIPSIEVANTSSIFLGVEFLQFLLGSLSGDLSADMGEAINNVFYLVSASYSSVLSPLLRGYVGGPLRDKANEAVSSYLKSYDATCPIMDPGFNATIRDDVTLWTFSAAIGISLLIGLLLFGLPYFRNRLCLPENEKKKLLASNPQIYGEEGTTTPQEYQGCLATNPRIPVLARYSIPFFIFANISLFIVSNTGIGASVYPRFTFGEKTLWLPSLFDFTLANSVRDMWKSGVYPLSLLIGFFSGAWPYMKLVMMLSVWLIPTRIFPSKWREQMLLVLDALGKWSLIDCYVMVLMLTSFHITLVPPNSPHSYLDVFVVPGWGFYTFVMATIMSLIITHVGLAFHRRSLEPERDPATRQIIQLNLQRYKIKRKSLSKKAVKVQCGDKWNVMGSILVTSLLIVTLVLIVVGALLRAFEFQIGGYAGFVMDFLGEHNSTSYSVYSLGNQIPASSYEPNSFAIRSIQATYFLFTLAIPLLHLIMLLVLWLVPFTIEQQTKVYKVTEVLNAWSALDVLVVALLVSLLELNQLAQFIIGDRCKLIDEGLKSIFGESLNGQTHCFAAHTVLSEGCWTLFCAVVLYLVVGTYVMRTCHSSLTKQQEKFEEKIEKTRTRSFP